MIRASTVSPAFAGSRRGPLPRADAEVALQVDPDTASHSSSETRRTSGPGRSPRCSRRRRDAEHLERDCTSRSAPAQSATSSPLATAAPGHFDLGDTSPAGPPTPPVPSSSAPMSFTTTARPGGRAPARGRVPTLGPRRSRSDSSSQIRAIGHSLPGILTAHQKTARTSETASSRVRDPRSGGVPRLSEPPAPQEGR